MSRKNKDTVKNLLSMMRWAYRKEVDVEEDGSFVDKVTAALHPEKHVPSEQLAEFVRWAHANPHVPPLEPGAEERFASDVLRRIRAAEEQESEGATFIEWFEIYASRSLRVTAPMAALLTCWLMTVGLMPDIGVRDLLNVGF